MPLIQEIQTEEWWEHVTPTMLENARKRLRLLVKLIDKQQRKPIYTDFVDLMEDEKEIEFAAFAAGDDFEQFRSKARRFLREHENHIATVFELPDNANGILRNAVESGCPVRGTQEIWADFRQRLVAAEALAINPTTAVLLINRKALQ
jgi:hypothetical protein